jgi:L-lactate dehydrogenase (cytochrome)
MKMCGVTSIDQLHPGYLNSLSIDHQIPTLDLATRLALVKSKL